MSVVPTSQCVADGSTKSTLVPVGTMSAVLPSIAERGKRRWTPLERVIPTESWVSVKTDETSGAHTPTQSATARVDTTYSSPVSSSRTTTRWIPSDSSSSRPTSDVYDATRAPSRAAVRAMATARRASSICAS